MGSRSPGSQLNQVDITPWNWISAYQPSGRLTGTHAEVGAITEETEACDWWSLGAVLFELLTGKTLVECHPAGINTHTTLNMPECVSEEARSLIQQLLQFNPMERLGAGVAGVEDIKSHPFFTPVDWAALMR